MKKPEWKKELDEKIATERETANNELTTHANTADIHRKIYISSASPTVSDGSNGDIWITYEA